MEHNTWTHSIWKIWSKKRKKEKGGDSIKYVNSSWNMLVNKTHNIFTYVNLTRGEPKLEGMFKLHNMRVPWKNKCILNSILKDKFQFWCLQDTEDKYLSCNGIRYVLNCKGNHNETEVTTYNTITRIYADTQAPHKLFKSSQSTIPFTLTQDSSTVQIRAIQVS